MKIRAIVCIAVAICFALSAVVFLKFSRFRVREEVVMWRQDFDVSSVAKRSGLPEGWRFRKKPGTARAVFSVEEDKKDGGSYLHMEADKASGSLMTRIANINLKDTSLLKWRWRVETLPTGADGRYKKKDDQAIGIYVGAGRLLNNKCVSYRWDTDTPKGAEGNCVYGKGAVKVKWFTLRNKNDVGQGVWLMEERNVADDFNAAWGYYPKKIYVSVSCNSQYTGTRAAADLDWIELVSMPGEEEDPGEGKE